MDALLTDVINGKAVASVRPGMWVYLKTYGGFKDADKVNIMKFYDTERAEYDY